VSQCRVLYPLNVLIADEAAFASFLHFSVLTSTICFIALNRLVYLRWKLKNNLSLANKKQKPLLSESFGINHLFPPLLILTVSEYSVYVYYSGNEIHIKLLFLAQAK